MFHKSINTLHRQRQLRQKQKQCEHEGLLVHKTNNDDILEEDEDDDCLTVSSGNSVSTNESSRDDACFEVIGPSCMKKPGSSSKSRNTVGFACIEIREYNRIPGDHPCVRDGVPLTLSWNYTQKGKISLDDYEEHRQIQRRKGGGRRRRQRSCNHISIINEEVDYDYAGALRLSAMMRKFILLQVFQIPQHEILAAEQQVLLCRTRNIKVSLNTNESSQGSGLDDDPRQSNISKDSDHKNNKTSAIIDKSNLITNINNADKSNDHVSQTGHNSTGNDKLEASPAAPSSRTDVIPMKDLPEAKAGKVSSTPHKDIAESVTLKTKQGSAFRGFATTKASITIVRETCCNKKVRWAPWKTMPESL